MTDLLTTDSGDGSIAVPAVRCRSSVIRMKDPDTGAEMRINGELVRGDGERRKNKGGIRFICLKDEDGHKSRGKQS